jgi:hypothetical protein
MGDVIRRRIQELMPAVDASLSPAGAEEILGVKPGALLAHGMAALQRRLDTIGIAL